MAIEIKITLESKEEGVLQIFNNGVLVELDDFPATDEVLQDAQYVLTAVMEYENVPSINELEK